MSKKVTVAQSLILFCSLSLGALGLCTSAEAGTIQCKISGSDTTQDGAAISFTPSVLTISKESPSATAKGPEDLQATIELDGIRTNDPKYTHTASLEAYTSWHRDLKAIESETEVTSFQLKATVSQYTVNADCSPAPAAPAQASASGTQ